MWASMSKNSCTLVFGARWRDWLVVTDQITGIYIPVPWLIAPQFNVLLYVSQRKPIPDSARNPNLQHFPQMGSSILHTVILAGPILPNQWGGSYSILKFAVVLQYIPGPVSQISAINSHSLSLPASLPHCCDPIPPLAPAVSWTDAPGHTCNGGHECSHLSKGYNIHPGILNMDAQNDGFFYFWKIPTYFGYLSNFRRKIH